MDRAPDPRSSRPDRNCAWQSCAHGTGHPELHGPGVRAGRMDGQRRRGDRRRGAGRAGCDELREPRVLPVADSRAAGDPVFPPGVRRAHRGLADSPDGRPPATSRSAAGTGRKTALKKPPGAV